LERQLRRASKGTEKTAASPEDAAESEKQLRFSATRFAAQRQKLGLSAADRSRPGKA
jgi:hypothetical protein